MTAPKVGDKVLITYGYGWDGPAKVIEVYPNSSSIEVLTASGKEGAFGPGHYVFPIPSPTLDATLSKDSVVKATNFLKGHGITITGSRVAGLAQIIEEAKNV